MSCRRSSRPARSARWARSIRRATPCRARPATSPPPGPSISRRRSPRWSSGAGAARRVALDVSGARFELVTPMGGAEVRRPLLGRFNVANALGVAACAWGLGVPVETVAERLTGAPQVPGRMERIAERPCIVLRDYAHTPDALERALETLRPLTAGRLIVVFGAG